MSCRKWDCWKSLKRNGVFSDRQLEQPTILVITINSRLAMHSNSIAHNWLIDIKRFFGLQDDDSSELGDKPAKDKPAKDEPAKDEPTKDEPTKDEPAKDEDPPIDHTLALAVADEINRMQTRLYILEAKDVKVKPLLKALERLEVQLSLQGYEIVDHKNKPYVEGMTAYPQFEEDNDLEDGKQIISGIIKPQVNYNGKLLQVPEIRVSYGG